MCVLVTILCPISYVCTTISYVNLRYRMSTYNIPAYQESRCRARRRASESWHGVWHPVAGSAVRRSPPGSARRQRTAVTVTVTP